jgi:hypothetical protein
MLRGSDTPQPPRLLVYEPNVLALLLGHVKDRNSLCVFACFQSGFHAPLACYLLAERVLTTSHYLSHHESTLVLTVDR